MPAQPRPTLSERLAHWCLAERWLIAVFLAALAVRLHWNLELHPPGDYIYSDMNGYVQRANALLRAPFKPVEYHHFFPWGTHAMVAAIKALFGADNYAAVGVVYAFLGAFTAACGYAVARRATAFSFVAPAVGLIGIFYYPQISLGGYILSEIPFSAFLMGALVFALRLVDTGRARDAWLMGLFAGVGAWFRPQILLSAAAIGVFWLIRRKALPNVKFTHFAQSAVPLLGALAISSALFYFNTGRMGIVSENGTFNLVFGRCHNDKLESLPDGKGHGHVHFRPPEFLQLNALERRMRKEGKEPPRTMDPALGDTIRYRGYVGDKEILNGYIRQCIEKTGWLKQLDYSVTNALFLWHYNIPWPDSGRSAWRGPARWWTNVHRDLFAIPALLSLVTIFIPGRRTAKIGLVALNLLALILLAAAVFGGIRHRTPYDYIIIFLALETYAFVGVWLYRFIRRRLRK